MLALSEDVRQDIGYGLFQAQSGKYPDTAKTLKGFGGGEVIELIQRDKAGTYRAVYTVRHEEVIIVLHVFQKKSNKGIATPKQEINLIHSRLKMAEEVYKDWKLNEGKKNE